MQDIRFGSAGPCRDAEASHLLIPQDHLVAFPWDQSIDRPFGNLAAHWFCSPRRFSPGIAGVSPEFASATSTVGLRRRQINELIEFWGPCSYVAARVGMDLR